MITKISNQKSTFEQVCNIINSNKTFSIYVHINVDFDAIGSALALKRALEQKGKIAHVFVDSELPKNSLMFEDINKINNEKIKDYDVCFVLDCSDENRLGRLKYKYRKNAKTVVSIDHHMEPIFFARYNIHETNISSTCELVYSLLKCLGVNFDKEICKLLISGIYTDTGSLKFSNTQPSTFNVLYDLHNMCGYVMDEITYPIFNSLSQEAFNLRKVAYNNVKMFDNSSFAITELTTKDFKSVGAAMSDTEGLVDLPMQIASIKVSVLMSEVADEPNVFRISIRSKGSVSANNIAKEFGGGGHMKAAGCKVSDSLDNLEKLMVDAIRKELSGC